MKTGTILALAATAAAAVVAVIASAGGGSQTDKGGTTMSGATTDVWLYSAEAVVPGIGPWRPLVAHKGAPGTPTPTGGWEFQQLEGVWPGEQQARLIAKDYIEARGGVAQESSAGIQLTL